MKAKVKSFRYCDDDLLDLELSFEKESDMQNFLMGILAADNHLVFGDVPAESVAKTAVKPAKAAEADKASTAAPKEPEKPAADAPAEESQVVDDFPAEGQADKAPRELASAASFKKVMEWMLANGHNTVDAIVALCEQWRKEIPAVSRLSGDLKERVGRALEVLNAK